MGENQWVRIGIKLSSDKYYPVAESTSEFASFLGCWRWSAPPTCFFGKNLISIKSIITLDLNPSSSCKIEANKQNLGAFFGCSFTRGQVSLKNRPAICGTLKAHKGVETRRNSHEVASTILRTSEDFRTLPPQKSRWWVSKLNLFLFTPIPPCSPPPPPRKTQKASLEPSLQAPGGATKEHTSNKPPVPLLFPGFPMWYTYLPTTRSPGNLHREAPSWTWTNGTCSPWPTRTRWEQGGRPGEQQLGWWFDVYCY